MVTQFRLWILDHFFIFSPLWNPQYFEIDPADIQVQIKPGIRIRIPDRILHLAEFVFSECSCLLAVICSFSLFYLLKLYYEVFTSVYEKVNLIMQLMSCVPLHCFVFLGLVIKRASDL